MLHTDRVRFMRKMISDLEKFLIEWQNLLRTEAVASI